jgi:hypothetical protein
MRQGPSFPLITLWSHVESSRITWWLCRYTGYVCYGLAGLWVCLLFFMRKRISMAIGVIKEASRAVGAMKAGRVGHALLPCNLDIVGLVEGEMSQGLTQCMALCT